MKGPFFLIGGGRAARHYGQRRHAGDEEQRGQGAQSRGTLSQRRAPGDNTFMTSHVGEYLQDLGIRPCCVLCKGGEGVKMIQNGMMMSYKHAPPAPSSSNGDERGGCRFSTRKVCLLARCPSRRRERTREGGQGDGRGRGRTRQSLLLNCFAPPPPPLFKLALILGPSIVCAAAGAGSSFKHCKGPLPFWTGVS